MSVSRSESYKAAGVDVTAGYEAVKLMKPMVESTFTKGVMGTLGGFGGPFTFTGGNGWTSQSISTTAAGVGVSGATQTFAATGVTTTITESAMPAGYALSALACSNVPAGGNATVDLVARTVTFDAAAMVRGAVVMMARSTAPPAASMLATQGWSSTVG